jgi:hypothetical protein
MHSGRGGWGGGLESRRLEKGTGRMEDTLLVQRKYQDINQDERKGEKSKLRRILRG